MSIQLAKTIVLAAMRCASETHINYVEAAAWVAIEELKDQKERLAAIQFANDTGVLSLEWKFTATDDRQLAKLLWNEFGDDITVEPNPKGAKDPLPKWKREIVDCPRAKKPSELAWHTKRLKKANLPLKLARVQLGEIFGGMIEWGDVERDVDAEWDEQENCFRVECGRGEYRGWDGERGIYMSADETFENNEHVIRIAL